MQSYAERWYDLDQFMTICFNEDMDDMYPGRDYRDSAKNAILDFVKTQPREQIQQVHLQLRELLREVRTEAELKTAARAMGCAWNFSPWRPWLESVLQQIDQCVTKPLPIEVLRSPERSRRGLFFALLSVVGLGGLWLANQERSSPPLAPQMPPSAPNPTKPDINSQTFSETFNNAPDQSDNWVVAWQTGAPTVIYTPSNFRIQAPPVCTGPSSGTSIGFRSRQSFVGDLDVSFELNHSGYGRTSVYLWSRNSNLLVMGADLDTNDTNYLNFTSGPNSTQYSYSSTPYLNTWITVRIQLVGGQVRFYADNGSGQQLLQTFPVPASSPPDTYSVVFSVGSVCWKSGPNDTSFRLIRATPTAR